MKPEDVPDGPLLIDTDVFSWVTWRRGPYRDFDSLIQGHRLALSFATVGELRAGALKASYGERNWRHLEEQIGQHYVILTATDPVVGKYAELHARFHEQLKGGGVNDMWTAACALAQPEPPPVVTGNHSDFQAIASRIPGSRSFIQAAKPPEGDLRNRPGAGDVARLSPLWPSVIRCDTSGA